MTTGSHEETQHQLELPNSFPQLSEIMLMAAHGYANQGLIEQRLAERDPSEVNQNEIFRGRRYHVRTSIELFKKAADIQYLAEEIMLQKKQPIDSSMPIHQEMLLGAKLDVLENEMNVGWKDQS